MRAAKWVGCGSVQGGAVGAARDRKEPEVGGASDSVAGTGAASVGDTLCPSTAWVDREQRGE